MSTPQESPHETWTGSAGARGPKVRSDCWAGVELRESGGLELELVSTVESYYGEGIRALLRAGCEALGLVNAKVRVEDGGAYPWVLMARLEAAVKDADVAGEDWLPELEAFATTSTSRDRFRRSRLYLPGNEPKYMVNAALHGPDAIILDLEDSVAPSAKSAARVIVRNALRQVDFGTAERMVRINQGEMGLADLSFIAEHGCHLVIIPKVEDAEEVHAVDARLRELTDAPVLLMPIIESAKGVMNAYSIATASERNVALTIGLEDYTADLGVQRTKEGRESLFARQAVINAARAAGLQALDTVHSDVSDPEGLRAAVLEARGLGFEGKGCIHPRQIPIVHEAFVPSEAEASKACAIVRAFRDAEARGLGVVSLGSKMIDPPVVKRALKTVEQAVQGGVLDASWESEEGGS
ncbi:MAG: aldolase/citrate lyase family protein [Planctomycetota bacterium]|nr:aldolase/citrate lyase family protein [Planctomycetota bacterium]